MKKIITTFSLLLCTFSLTLCGAPSDPAPIKATPVEETVRATPLTPEPSPPIQEPTQIADKLPSYEHAFIKMLLSLGALLVLIFLTVWALKRLSSGRLKFMNNALAIKILEKRSLSPKSVLYLVEVSGKKVLIAESQLEIKRLMEVEEIIETDQ